MKSKISENVLKLFYYTKREGIGALVRRGVKTAFPAEATYDRWKKKHHLSAKIFQRQKYESGQWNLTVDVVPLGNKKAFPMLRKSLQEQSACIGILRNDYRTGKGEFVLLAGSDVYLSSNALFEFGRYIQRFPETDWFYCDHDVKGKVPFFKPDFNRSYLQCYPYIGPIIVVRRSILEKFLLLEGEILLGNIYGLQLNLADFSGHIGHIAKVLYHVKEVWPEKSRVNENKDQLTRYFEKKRIGCTVKDGIAFGTYDVEYSLVRKPLISIIIPNKNHSEDLKKCLASLFRQSYSNFEVLIVENNSTEPAIFELYSHIEQRYRNIQVLKWEHPFNYSAINNFAVSYASGEYLLFLNNDIEFINGQSIERMIELGEQKETGAVGIKLLYPGGNIQHAGVIIGYGGIAGHAFLGCDGASHGYMDRIDCVQNYSAVTGACMLVKRLAFEQCGGFDEELQIAFNDIDFCLRLGALGFEIVYTPYALAWHYESKSRGREDTFEKMRRFNREVSLFCKRWKCIIKRGDKAYNPNLSLEKWDFSLRL